LAAVVGGRLRGLPSQTAGGWSGEADAEPFVESRLGVVDALLYFVAEVDLKVVRGRGVVALLQSVLEWTGTVGRWCSEDAEHQYAESGGSVEELHAREWEVQVGK